MKENESSEGFVGEMNVLLTTFRSWYTDVAKMNIEICGIRVNIKLGLSKSIEWSSGLKDILSKF